MSPEEIYDTGYQVGYSDAVAKHAQDLVDAYDEGYDRGFNAGWSDGYSDGYNDGEGAL